MKNTCPLSDTIINTAKSNLNPPLRRLVKEIQNSLFPRCNYGFINMTHIIQRICVEVNLVYIDPVLPAVLKGCLQLLNIIKICYNWEDKIINEVHTVWKHKLLLTCYFVICSWIGFSCLQDGVRLTNSYIYYDAREGEVTKPLLLSRVFTPHWNVKGGLETDRVSLWFTWVAFIFSLYIKFICGIHVRCLFCDVYHYHNDVSSL